MVIHQTQEEVEKAAASFVQRGALEEQMEVWAGRGPTLDATQGGPQLWPGLSLWTLAQRAHAVCPAAADGNPGPHISEPQWVDRLLPVTGSGKATEPEG